MCIGYTLVVGGAGLLTLEGLIKVTLPTVDLKGLLYATSLVLMAWGARYVSRDRQWEIVLAEINEMNRPTVEIVDEATDRLQHQRPVNPPEEILEI